METSLIFHHGRRRHNNLRCARILIHGVEVISKIQGMMDNVGKIVKTALIISLCVNLLLFGYVYVGRSSDSTKVLHTEATSNINSDHDRIDYPISESQKEHVVTLVELELGAASSSYNSLAISYWEPNSRVVLEMMEEQQRSAQWIREELLSTYGDQAIDEHAFAEYFYPLGPGFEFMSSTQQIAVSILRDQYRANLAGNAGRGVQSFSEFQTRESTYLAKVQELLGDDDFFEFQLRESQLAQQMKNSGFDWTEGEFRAVYTARSQVAGEGNIMVSANIYDDSIKEVLGVDRYMDYLKLSDPNFQRITAEVSRSGGPSSDADEAYEVYVEYGEQISDAIENRDLRRAQKLQTERDQSIQETTGITLSQPRGGPFSMPNIDGLRVK